MSSSEAPKISSEYAEPTETRGGNEDEEAIDAFAHPQIYTQEAFNQRLRELGRSDLVDEESSPEEE